MKSLVIAAIALFFILPVHADTAEKLATIRIEIDDEALRAAPWLNTTEFILIRDANDPALAWFEKLSGKSIRNDLEKGPILLFNGFDDAEYFVSKRSGSVLLHIDSMRHRDAFSTAILVTAARMPKDKDLKFYRIRKVEEDKSRLGHQSASSFGK